MSMVRTPSLLLLTVFLGACGGEDDGSAAAQVPAEPVMGSFELPDTTLAFRVVRCDLTGTAPDGIFLRGSNTRPDGTPLSPDGRRMSIEVERLTPDMGGPGWIYERATVQFGTLMDEDAWEATASSRDGSAWTTGDFGVALDGPIIQVSGNELVVDATYKHVSRDEEVEGTLRVTCPATAGP